MYPGLTRDREYNIFVLTSWVNISDGHLALEIVFRTKKLQKQCTDTKEMQRSLGSKQAKRLRQRLDDLRASPTLEVMRSLPGRCHELKGDREGELSVDLEHPYRLIFEPANNPVPKKGDGGLDWSRVSGIRILGIEDTHG